MEMNAGQRLYYKRKEQGICTHCGGEIEEERKGRVLCAKCNCDKKMYEREVRAISKKLGFCPACGKNRLYGDEKRCPECRAYQTNYALQHRDREKHNEQNRAWHSRNVAIWREQGLCTRCGKEIEDKRYKRCTTCVNHTREYARVKRYKGIDKHKRVEQGLCYQCGKPQYNGSKLCEEHYKTVCKNLKKDNSNHQWRKIRYGSYC